MKEIKFTNLKIKNFRNINELEINFGEKETIIKGKNKLGKTNILHSIIWCLFGKNIYNEKQFTISPIINNIEDNSITTNVKLTINNEYIISRTYYNRVTKLEVGFIDNEGKENLVLMTQNQYLKDLQEKYVDEETFKSLSNIEYITNMNWKDLKKLIFELIGEIKDEEVLIRDNFDLIEDLIKNFGIEKAIEQISITDKNLTEEIKRLETEYQTTINMKEKYVSDVEDNKKLEERKKEIELILSNSKEKEESIQKLRNEEKTVRDEIETLKMQIRKNENEFDFNLKNIEDYKTLYNNSANSVEDIRNIEKSKINSTIKVVRSDIILTEQLIDRQKKIVEDLKNKGNELKNKEVKIENVNCPTCKQELPKEMLEETLMKAKQEKQVELEKIKEEYEQSKEKLTSYEEDLKLNKESLNKLEKELEDVDKKEYVIEETDKQKQIRIAKEQKEIDNNEIEKNLVIMKMQLEELEEKYNKMEKPIFIDEDNTPLILELNDINTKLATTITLNKLSEDITTIKNNLESKKENKIKNKNKQEQCIKFNNCKAELLKQKISKYFKYVNFRTKDFTNDGQEVETFKIVNENNVEYKECSTGEKIQLGIELLTVIQEFKGIKIPLLLDEITVLTSDINSNTQIIGTVANKEIDSLKIEVK